MFNDLAKNYPISVTRQMMTLGPKFSESLVNTIAKLLSFRHRLKGHLKNAIIILEDFLYFLISLCPSFF